MQVRLTRSQPLGCLRRCYQLHSMAHPQPRRAQVIDQRGGMYGSVVVENEPQAIPPRVAARARKRGNTSGTANIVGRGIVEACGRFELGDRYATMLSCSAEVHPIQRGIVTSQNCPPKKIALPS